MDVVFDVYIQSATVEKRNEDVLPSTSLKICVESELDCNFNLPPLALLVSTDVHFDTIKLLGRFIWLSSFSKVAQKLTCMLNM